MAYGRGLLASVPANVEFCLVYYRWKCFSAIARSWSAVRLAMPVFSIKAYSSLFLPMTNLRSLPSISASRWKLSLWACPMCFVAISRISSRPIRWRFDRSLTSFVFLNLCFRYKDITYFGTHNHVILLKFLKLNWK